MENAMTNSQEVCERARLSRDARFDGRFFVGVRTTGIYCRPICPANPPKSENVTFYRTAAAASEAGYRPCLRCRPVEAAGPAPGWLDELVSDVDADPQRRWTDADLAARSLRPEQVRRWFHRTYGMTFHAYARARRRARHLVTCRGVECRDQTLACATQLGHFVFRESARPEFLRSNGTAE